MFLYSKSGNDVYTNRVLRECSFSVSAKPMVVTMFTTDATDMPELLPVLPY